MCSLWIVASRSVARKPFQPRGFGTIPPTTTLGVPRMGHDCAATPVKGCQQTDTDLVVSC